MKESIFEVIFFTERLRILLKGRGKQTEPTSLILQKIMVREQHTPLQEIGGAFRERLVTAKKPPLCSLRFADVHFSSRVLHCLRSLFFSITSVSLEVRYTFLFSFMEIGYNLKPFIRVQNCL